MQRTRLAVLLALALSGCVDSPDIIFDPAPPDVIINHECPCAGGSCTHVVNITEEVYVTEAVYVTEEDTTPDVVQEFYGDASSLPVLLWTEIGEPPMPKKFSELAAATELNDADIFAISQAGTSKKIAASVFALPTNYIGGLITSNDAVDADHDIAIAPGVARSADDSASLKLAAILTKQIDATWAVGDDAGGMESADHPVQADTMYALWLIKRPDTGVVDAMFSLDYSSPTLPANYTKKRLIGSVRTDSSSNIIAYVQSGDYFRYTGDIIQDVADSTITSTTFETGTLSVPPKALATIRGSHDNTTATDELTAQLWVRYKGAADATTTQEAFMNVQVAANFDRLTGQGTVLVDSSREMEYAVSELSGSSTVVITTVGFLMLTRREP